MKNENKIEVVAMISNNRIKIGPVTIDLDDADAIELMFGLMRAFGLQPEDAFDKEVQTVFMKMIARSLSNREN